MELFADLMWACDRLMLCKGAIDCCEVHAIGYWMRAAEYYEGKIELLQEWM